MTRTAIVERTTKETEVRAIVTLEGSGHATVNTGIGFLDHMVNTLARFSGIDLALTCSGDLHVDAHHTTEDCALTLGAALDQALGERRGIRRFGHAYAPLDEALARAVVDLSGRPWPEITLGLKRDRLGEMDTDDLVHFMQSLAIASRSSVHVDVLRGRYDHHRAEAAFKALSLALGQAVRRDGTKAIPSTKGAL